MIRINFETTSHYQIIFHFIQVMEENTQEESEISVIFYFILVLDVKCRVDSSNFIVLEGL